MDFSHITGDLLVGTAPSAPDFDTLWDLGVRLVINMRSLHGPPPGMTHQNLTVLWLRTLDNPITRIPIRKLAQGAIAALEAIHKGGKVYSHCAQGMHRSVAMGAAILIAQGHDPFEAMCLIKAQRPLADPHIFYIRERILRFSQHWQNLLNQPEAS